ncbi:RE1 [Symbiodinium sp. KB8]|nr:RE1 [Symbiodinium sp. KB8]
MTEILRSKDGVPIWNGEAGSFQEFEETALIWEQSIAMNKRYLCGPKLIAELTGAAKRLVAGKRHDWVSHNRGVRDLMKHLRACLGKPLVSDLTEHLNRYFKSSRRRPNESMNDYITRKCEVYLRACQALQRVTPHHDQKPSSTTPPATTGGTSRRSSWDSSSGVNQVDIAADVQAAAPVGNNPGATDDDGEAPQDDEAQDPWWWNSTSWWSSSTWWQPSYSGYYQPWYSSGDWEWTPPAWHTTSPDTRPAVPELLPDFVQGWYLLQDSGLDTSERNMIMAALGGEFSLQRVAQELRNQWSGHEGTRRRDGGNRHSGFWGEVPQEDDDYDHREEDDEEAHQDWDEDEQAMWAGAEDEAQSALAAMEQAKRTLRAARARQHSVRMARQYFRPQGRGTGGAGRGRGTGQKDDSQLTCLRCGKVGHRVANCPQPAQAAKVVDTAEATSSFICYADRETDAAYATGLTTAEAVKQGMAVIDGGATRTLASVSAMEAIMSINHKKHGHNGVENVDLGDRPVFGFGNGSEDQCASTVLLRIAADNNPGALKVHCLDQGNGPLLLSVESLSGLLSTSTIPSVCLIALLANMMAVTLTKLDKMTKEQLRKYLLDEYQEHAYTRWTKPEIRQRILELQSHAAGVPMEELHRGTTLTATQAAIREVRKAAKKKAELVQLCERTYGMEVNKNDTISILEARVIKVIYDTTEPEAGDVIGFGKNGHLLYRDMLAPEHENYATWVMTTAHENPTTGCDPRLYRLAKWLEGQNMEGRKAKIGNSMSHPTEKKTSQGYPKVALQDRKIEALAEVLAEIRTELKEIKGDKVRKQAGRPTTDAEMTEGSQSDASFYKIGTPPATTKTPKVEQLSEQQARSLDGDVGDEVVHEDRSGDAYVTADGCREVFAEEQTQKVEAQAQELMRQQQYQHKHCEGLIHMLPQSRHKNQRSVIQEERPRYLTFGLYAYGNQYGVTKCTLKFPKTCQYLLQYLQHWAREPLECTSFVINDNGTLKLHKDHHNSPGYPNYLMGITAYQKGGNTAPDGAIRREVVACYRGFPVPRQTRVAEAMVIKDRGFCDRHGIYLDIIPGEAHWQIGATEQAVQGLKQLMDKLAEADPEITSDECLSIAVSTFNQRELVRGFSPTQHVLGQSPDHTGRHIDPAALPPEEPILNSSPAELRREAKLRAEAEKALADWMARQRVNKALNSRTRPLHQYQPGDLVYFWRTQESGQGKRSPGTKHGRFLGPARILAMEPRKDATGSQRSSHAIWCVRGRQLIKCSPEQLRPASEREELVEALAEDQGTPWTYSRLAQELGGNQFEDISQEVPDEQEWQRAQDVTQELAPTRYRLGRKRPPPTARPEEGTESMEELYVGTQTTDVFDHQKARATASRQRRPHAEAPQGVCWWSEVKETSWQDSGSPFWDEEHAAVAVEVDLPGQTRQWNQVTRDLGAYLACALKKRAVEVSEKRLSATDREKFQKAKMIEVKNFLAAEAFEALPDNLKPNKDQAVGMRWILTWKMQESGEPKAKARAVLLGYQDPSYEHRATTAPVMTRQTRQLILQLAANKRWQIMKGDVSGAFLQGRSYPDELYCVPCPEICREMGLPAETVTRLKKACYGLVDAPLEWYKTVASFLEELGLERLWSDACAWVWRKDGQVRGMISGHVDDFIFAGSSTDAEWHGILEKIKAHFKWGDWDVDCFTQCGVQVETTKDGFTLGQPKYLEGVSEIHVNANRRKERHASTTEREKTQLRGLLGALSWHSQQVAPHLAADVSLLLSEVTQSNVETIFKANTLLAHAKARSSHQLKVHRCVSGEMVMVAWVDAGSQNRHDGGSTQGVIIGAAPTELLQGEVTPVSLVAWHSNRIDRSCRSPGAAETQAAVNGEDSLYFARFQWSEMLYGQVNTRNPDAVVQRVPGCLVTDSRNVYDKLNTEVVSIKGAEKRTNIEALALKESQQNTGLIVRWVHSEAQLANSLTKAGGKNEIEMYYKMCQRWRIVEDPEMKSARRRKEEGIEPLAQREKQNVLGEDRS